MLSAARAAAAAAPVVVAFAVFFARTRAVPINGDEPHYLMMADSVAFDRDLDLQNNYLRDFDTHRIFGLVIPHVYNVRRGWMPYHTPGLGILLALPFALGAIQGARLALVFFTGVFSWSLIAWFDRGLPRGAAAWLTAAIMISLPIVFGAPQIYPDLPGGIVTTALALWMLRPPAPGPLFWLIVGLLPWLHVKYIGITIVFVLAGLVGARRPTMALAAIGVAALAAFNVWAFETPLGARGANELTRSPSRFAMIFLGLHLDQSQGMFVQNPLLLAGVAALPLFVRSRPRTALFWTMLYASAIVPNALELARYGGGGPVGRFGWTAAWLWSIPIGVLVHDRRDAVASFIKPAAMAAITYQAALAVRWWRNTDLLFPRFDDPRDSLFPDSLRAWLPSFYFWDFSSYWKYGPNLVAFVIVVLLLMIGTYRVGRTRTEHEW